jgi:hypothetical protein
VAFSRFDLGSGAAAQKRALDQIARLIAKGCSEPAIVRAARAITRDCDPRDDQCELEAIYDAVKHGTDRVPGLENGLRYVADPRTSDYYVGAVATLRECVAGACAGDCDEHTILVAALCGAIGFKVGARAYGPDPKKQVFEHVYAVVAMPKRGPWKPSDIVGMDTTVPDASPGWQPPKGAVLTFWIEEG